MPRSGRMPLLEKIKNIFCVCMEKVGEGYGGERNLW